MVLSSLTIFVGQELYQKFKDKFLPVAEMFCVETTNSELRYAPGKLSEVVLHCIQFCVEFGLCI